MFAMPPTGGAAQKQVSKGKEDSPSDNKQDSAYHHPGVSRAGANGGASGGAAPKGENQFKGAGTNREALKAQFQAHVTAKQESAAQAVKQEAEDKKKYEDAKFAAQDEIDSKVTEWAGPKHNRKNLRAMLACFDLVTTWPRAREKWVKVGLHELVMPADVKKIHRKAILLVHPGLVSPVPVTVRSGPASFPLPDVPPSLLSYPVDCWWEHHQRREVLVLCCCYAAAMLLLCRQCAVFSVRGV